MKKLSKLMRTWLLPNSLPFRRVAPTTEIKTLVVILSEKGKQVIYVINSNWINLTCVNVFYLIDN